MSDNYTTKDILKNANSPMILKKVVETLLNQKVNAAIEQKKQEMALDYLKDKK